MVGLVKALLAEQAHVVLRDLIVGGQLMAGHRLMPDELGQILSINPTPVRTYAEIVEGLQSHCENAALQAPERHLTRSSSDLLAQPAEAAPEG